MIISNCQPDNMRRRQPDKIDQSHLRNDQGADQQQSVMLTSVNRFTPIPKLTAVSSPLKSAL